MGKKRKPKTPAQILAEAAAQRRKDFAAAGLAPEVADLVTHADVQVVRASQKHGKTFAWRSNVFRLLRERKTIDGGHFNAAQQLIQDWAEWRGLDGKPDLGGEVVDNGRSPPDRRSLVSQRMVNAGKRIWGDGERLVGVFQQIEPRHVPLLAAFMVATVEEDRPMAWRGIVQRIIGETVRDKQTAAVVDALEALRSVYEQPRRAAA